MSKQGNIHAIHADGGLGQHWGEVLGAEAAHAPGILTDRTREYAAAVKASRVTDTNFAHREYLGSNDWERVVELFGDVLGKDPVVEIGRYALLETARNYTLQDYVADELAGRTGTYSHDEYAPRIDAPYVWNGERWAIAHLDRDEAYSVFDPSVRQMSRMSERAGDILKDIFMVPLDVAVTDRTPPEKLFRNLVIQSQVDEAGVTSRLPDPWQRVEARTDIPASANPSPLAYRQANRLRNAYTDHFGVLPAVDFLVYAHDDTNWTVSLNPAADMPPAFETREAVTILPAEIKTSAELPPLPRSLILSPVPRPRDSAAQTHGE